MKKITILRRRGKSEILSGLPFKIGIYQYAFIANRQEANVKHNSFLNKKGGK